MVSRRARAPVMQLATKQSWGRIVSGVHRRCLGSNVLGHQFSVLCSCGGRAGLESRRWRKPGSIYSDPRKQKRQRWAARRACRDCVVSSRSLTSPSLLLRTYSLCRGAALFVEAPVWGNDSRTEYHRLLWLLRISAYGTPLKDLILVLAINQESRKHPRWQISLWANPSFLWANLASHSKRSTVIGPGPVSVVLPSVPSNLFRQRFHQLPSIDAMLPRLPFVGFPEGDSGKGSGRDQGEERTLTMKRLLLGGVRTKSRTNGFSGW